MNTLRAQPERIDRRDDMFPGLQIGSNYGNTVSLRVGWNMNQIERMEVFVIFFLFFVLLMTRIWKHLLLKKI